MENNETVDMRVTPEMKDLLRVLRDAMLHNAVAVLGTKRKSDGKMVGVVVVMMEDAESYIMMPLAVLLVGDDIDDYEGPGEPFGEGVLTGQPGELRLVKPE